MPSEAPFTVNPGGFALLLWLVLSVIGLVAACVLLWFARRGFKSQVSNLDLIPQIAQRQEDIQEKVTSQSGAITALHTRMDKMGEQNRRMEIRTAERFARIETKLSLVPLPPDDDSGEHAPVSR